MMSVAVKQIILIVLGLALTVSLFPLLGNQRGAVLETEEAALEAEKSAIKSTVVYGKTIEDFHSQQDQVLSRAYALRARLEPNSPEMEQWEAYIENVKSGWAEQIKRGRRTKKRIQEE